MHLSADFGFNTQRANLFPFPFLREYLLTHVLFIRVMTELLAVIYFDIISSFTLISEMEEIESMEIDRVHH